MTFTGDNRNDDMIPPAAENSLPLRDGAPLPPEKSEEPAVRTEICAVTGDTLPREDMIRLAVGPDRRLYPDFEGKLPGPGVWVGLGRDTLRRAVRRNIFTTLIRDQVEVPENIEEMIETGLRRKALDMISMARKAGFLMTGADKCEQILRSRKAGVYLTAAEEQAVTRRKLVGLARNIPVFDRFGSDELSARSGAQNVWHAVIRTGPLCAPFLLAVARMDKFND